MILVLGASGYIGSEFARQLAAKDKKFMSVGRRDCDLYDVDELSKFMEFHDADCVINCAGYTGKPNVDACETDKTNCLAGNAVLPGIIAAACQNVGIPWGHISSGCIYTGTRSDGAGFRETDPPNFSFRQNNCSFYSGTKALGEEILADAKDCYIWRVRIPFSQVDSPRNYLSKLMRYDRLLDAENSLSNLQEFVSASLDCLEKRLPFGIYNLTNPGRITTKEVVQLIRESGVSTRDFRFFDSEDEFLKIAAKTPRSNCAMDHSKAVAAGLKLTEIRDSIRRALASWIPQPQQQRVVA